MTMPEGMSAYLWLVWFSSSIPQVPKRWLLAVSYEAEEEALGCCTAYEVRQAILCLKTLLNMRIGRRRLWDAV
jgi:hypothetical protein